MTAHPASPRRARRYPAAAFGPVEPLGPWRRVAVLVVVVGLLGSALLVRATGLLRPAPPDPSLPPLPAAAAVTPGLVRGGHPEDLDLLRLRDEYGIRTVVDVDGMDIEEQAVARGLGLRTAQLNVPDGGIPSAEELRELVRLLHATGTGPVYLHDSTGHGPVLVVAAMLHVLCGASLSEALRGVSSEAPGGLSPGQLLALYEVAAVATGEAPPGGRYAALGGVTW